MIYRCGLTHEPGYVESYAEAVRVLREDAEHWEREGRIMKAHLCRCIAQELEWVAGHAARPEGDPVN